MCIEQIRASHSQQTVEAQGLHLLDKSQKTFYHSVDFKRWTDFIVDSLSSSITLAIAAVAVCSGAFGASTVGLAVVIAASISEKITMLMTFLATLKSLQPSIVCLLRFIAETPTEVTEPQLVQAIDWPTLGDVELRHITASYGYVFLSINLQYDKSWRRK